MKSEKSFKIVKTAFEFLLGVIVVLFIGFFILSKVSTSPLFVFNKTAMWVMTDSMDPTIPPKTYILVESVTADEVEVDDIIVFRSTDPEIYGEFNTHRVIGKDGDNFITRGDRKGLPIDKYPALAENVVGRYVKTLPVMTFIGRIVMTSAGFAALIVLFLIAMVFCIIPDVKEAIETKRKENEEEKEREKKRLIEEEIRRLKESENHNGSDE